MTVGDHHVRHLVQRLPSHLDTVHLKHLVVDRQQAGALRQPAGNHAGDKDPRNLLQALRSDPHAGAVPDVEAQRFLLAVLVQANASVRLGEDVHIDDGGDGAEVPRKADDHRWLFPVGVRSQKNRRKHCVLLPRQRVRAKRVISFLCGIKDRGRRERWQKEKRQRGYE